MALLRPRTRAVWLRLHRWLGLGLGAVFVLFGLTGSLLVFYVGIDEALEPALAVPGPGPQVHSWQAVLEALQRAHPQRDRGWRIELPPGGRGLVTARYLKPAETADAFYKPLLSDWSNYENWQDAGAKTATDRAHELWPKLRDQHVPPPLDPAIREALDAYVAKRKEEMGK